MWMYSKSDVREIVEEFLAEHFNFGSVYLNAESQCKLDRICNNYGIEVENVQEQ